ncbi:MAG: hypothetical protein RhofKO_33960 [Rhodothermales bacterium]
MSHTFSFILLGVCLVACGAVRPSAELRDQIGFVRLEVTALGAHVVSAEAEPGRLKPSRRAPEGTFQVDVVDAEGQTLWTSAMDDPLRQRQEYVDEAGNLQNRWLTRDKAEVVVRVPVTAAQQTLQVYRFTESASKRSADTHLATLTVTW